MTTQTGIEILLHAPDVGKFWIHFWSSQWCGRVCVCDSVGSHTDFDQMHFGEASAPTAPASQSHWSHHDFYSENPGVSAMQRH